MPSSCPNCHTYDGLTSLINDDLQPTGKIECENCLWTGWPDDLDWTDSNAPES